jgi:hypothetical protein
MADGPERPQKPDRDRVNLDDEPEVRRWCLHWGCTLPELRVAVQAVGVMTKDVQAHLRSKGQIANWWDYPFESL